MDIFLTLMMYIVIGFGFMRTMSQIDTKFGRDCKDNILVIMFWPFILMLIAFNAEMVVKKEDEDFVDRL